MICSKTDAPDCVIGAGFDQDAFARAEEELREVGILRELREVAIDHEPVAFANPSGFVKATDLSAEFLGLLGMRGLKDFLFGLRIAEDTRFPCHHEMLGGGVAGAIDGERGRKPLAEAGLGNGAVCGWRVTPERQVFGTVSLLVAMRRSSIDKMSRIGV